MTNPYPIPREARATGILSGNGGASYGPFGFKIFDTADVEVITKPDGADGYSVAAVTVAKVSSGALDHFTITFPAALPATTKFQVRGRRVHERSAGVTAGTQLSPDALERELSKQAATLEELRRDAPDIDPGIEDGQAIILKGGRLAAGPAASVIEAIPGLAAQVAADRVQTGLDRAATAADRVQTGLDRAATGLDAQTAVAAALTAGAPWLPGNVLTSPTPANGTTGIITGAGGVQLWAVVAGAWKIQRLIGKIEFTSKTEMLAFAGPLGPAGTTFTAAGERFEVAPAGVADHAYTTYYGDKIYWSPQFIASPTEGRATVALDVKHFSRQGSSPNTSPVMVAGHDYTDAERSVQVDKVGGNIASGSYVMGLRRGSNHINRPDKDGTYVSEAGFLRCSYDKFAETAAFTGEISANVLTVSAVSSGTLAAGQFLQWSGTDNGTTIVSQTSGTAGGAGTYTVAVRGQSGASQTVSSTAMTAETKSEVLAFYIGQTGDFGWSTDRVRMTTGYSGGLYAFSVNATAAEQFIASFSSASGGFLNLLDAVGGTRTDIVAPANQTSGMRLEAAGGGIDIAPKPGSPVTVRGNINSQTGSDMAITAVGGRLDLNGSNGVRSLAPLRSGHYNMGTLPSAAAYLGFIIFVSNGDAGAPCLAVSDGANWLRISLGAAVAAS